LKIFSSLFFKKKEKRKKMLQDKSSDITRTINDRLSNRWLLDDEFNPLLRKHNAFIAGSFVVKAILDTQFENKEWEQATGDEFFPLLKQEQEIWWEDQDVDIWVPDIRESGEHSHLRKKMLSEWKQYFKSRGYHHVTSSNNKWKTKANYVRLNRLVRDIVTFATRPQEDFSKRLRIQLIVYDATGSDTRFDITRDFDMRFLFPWFNGIRVFAPDEESQQDIYNKNIIINMLSDDVQKQSFVEWRRTAQRIRKYEKRGFRLDNEHKWNTEAWNTMITTILERGSIPDPWCHREDQCCEKRWCLDFRQNKQHLELIYAFCIKWNQIFEQSSVPNLYLTLMPRQAGWTGLRLMWRKFDGLHFLRMPWADMTPEEKARTEPNHFLPAATEITSVNIGKKKSQGVFQKEFFEKLDIPSFIPPEQKYNASDLVQRCFDFLMAEETDISEYLADEDNKADPIIFVKFGATMTSTCTQKSNLTMGKKFMECAFEDTFDHHSVLKDAVFQRIELGTGPVYITQENMDMILASTAVYYGVYDTPRKLLFSVSVDSFEGRENFVSADHCGLGTDKQLSVIAPLQVS
jgi:hypothetical protein